jgi:hypothetical protein
VDVCPQANLSELFLGGLTGHGGKNLLTRQGLLPRCGLGGYFQVRLPSPYNVPGFDPNDFITVPSKFNPQIPSNIDLVCGDPLLELQANAINTLSNTQIPGTNTWVAVIDWLNDFFSPIDADIGALITMHPGYFTFNKPAAGTVEIRDFQTTGVVAFAKGCPIFCLRAGKQDIGGHRVQVKEDYRHDCQVAVDQLTKRL